MKTQKVWFITGASKGLGLSFVKRLLNDGEKVAATSRNIHELTQAVGTIQNEQFLPLEMDLVNEQSVKTAIKKTLSHFKSIDVVVNNAGYGQMGTLEELSDAESRRNFDVNVFGLLNVIRNVMPHLRGQRSGHILNISSIGGYTGGFTGWGVYCATKFAVTGLTEALAVEAQPFGVRVTSVYPGYFRTSFLTQESMMSPANPIAEYLDARASQAAHQNDINGNQPGDPDKAVDVMIRAVNADEPVVHLFLGQDAYDRAYTKMESVKNDLAAWEAYATATAFATVPLEQ